MYASFIFHTSGTIQSKTLVLDLNFKILNSLLIFLKYFNVLDTSSPVKDLFRE